MYQKNPEHQTRRTDEEYSIWLPGALLGLAVQPWETTPALLREERPKFVFSFLLLLFLTMFGPALAYIWKFGATVYLPDKIYIYITAFSIFLVAYFLLEGIFFFLLGFEFTLMQLLAVVVYSLTPLISFFLIIYGFTYLTFQNFNLIAYLSHAGDGSRQYLMIVPYLLMIAQFSWLLIVAFSIKALDDAQPLSSFIYAALSVIPLGTAVIASSYLVEIFYPGGRNQITPIISYLVGIWSK